MSGILDIIEKQPTEKFPRGHDWSKNLPSGTSVGSVAVTAVDLDTMADATSTIIDSSSTTGGVTTFVLKAGTDRKDYRITLRLTRSDGNIFEDDYLLRVREV